MLWYAERLMPRFNLRLNGAQRCFYVRSNEINRWEMCQNAMMGSVTACVHFNHDASMLHVLSRKGFPQRLFVVNVDTNRVLAHFHIVSNGSFSVNDGMAMSIDAISEDWKRHMLLIVGVKPTFTMNITDVLGDDEDVLRHKNGKTRMFFPHRYADGKKTPAYDDPPVMAMSMQPLNTDSRDLYQSCLCLNAEQPQPSSENQPLAMCSIHNDWRSRCPCNSTELDSTIQAMAMNNVEPTIDAHQTNQNVPTESTSADAATNKTVPMESTNERNDIQRSSTPYVSDEEGAVGGAPYRCALHKNGKSGCSCKPMSK